MTAYAQPCSGAQQPAPSRPLASNPRPWWRRPVFGLGLPLLIGLVHVALVAPHYFVGSFDDDASYILTARALLAGHGLTGHETGGAVVVGLYPPGYGALLAPLAWLWPHTFVPMRLLSVACYALVFVLTWVYLGRRGVGEGVRSAVLVILALGPAVRHLREHGHGRDPVPRRSAPDAYIRRHLGPAGQNMDVDRPGGRAERGLGDLDQGSWNRRRGRPYRLAGPEA